MFVSFDLLVFLFWMLVSTFLPGAILSFSIFRKDDFGALEKLLIGFALGFFLLPMIPFLLYLVAGIKFSYTIALLSVAVLYAISLVFFIKNKVYEVFANLHLFQNKTDNFVFQIPSQKTLLGFAIPALLILVLVVTYLIRIGSYSPIFQELDPYYYTYVAQQILTVGFNPLNDQTGWFPEVVVDHREIPAISYLESIWYSLYSGGGHYDNMLLALIASMYPPLAAILAVFFIYLLVSTISRKKWGLVAAAVATAVPAFIYKLSAGEQEVQPYAFFGILFFFAMYALCMKKKDLKFAVLSGIAFAAVALGSSSQILVIGSLIIFMILQSSMLFIRDKNNDALKYLLVSNAIIFVIGPLLGSAILKDIFVVGAPTFSMAGAVAIPVFFIGVLYLLKEKLAVKNHYLVAFVALVVVALLAYLFTPLGGYIKNIGTSGLSLAEYTSPLYRTIAEQGQASGYFDDQMGFIAESQSIPDQLGSPDRVLALLKFYFLLPFTVLGNLVLQTFTFAVNAFLGTSVAFSDKPVSFLLFWVVSFIFSLVYCAWKFSKNEDDALFVLFAAMILPPLLVGILKTKYTIYAGVLLAVAAGFVLGQVNDIIPKLADGDEKKGKKKDGKDILKYSYILLFIGAAFVLLQFFNHGLAPALLWGSMHTLYQNDPAALGAKFQTFCAVSGDSEVCAAAADPLGYAGKGTNYQYSTRLCMLSLLSNYSYINNLGAAPGGEGQAAMFRCQRITDYWIDSMEWISKNTEPDARITSWWDYGHWINYFGQRDTVLRNEHASHSMIGDVAHGYVDATPDELKKWMLAHDSKYALFDIELIAGGGSLGGKYGALNYLSCARDNETNVSFSPGESECEGNHLWETVFVSSSPCTISKLANKTGYTAYKVYIGPKQLYLPYYPDFCFSSDAQAIAACKYNVRVKPEYCVGPVTLANGQQTMSTYYLNETAPNGDLKLNKAFLQMPFQLPNTPHMGPVTGVTLLYTEDKVWLENGEVTSGYEDRKGKFYDSAIYRAIFTDSLPGFKQVYSTSSGAVKIYKIE